MFISGPEVISYGATIIATINRLFLLMILPFAFFNPLSDVLLFVFQTIGLVWHQGSIHVRNFLLLFLRSVLNVLQWHVPGRPFILEIRSLLIWAVTPIKWLYLWVLLFWWLKWRWLHRSGRLTELIPFWTLRQTQISWRSEVIGNQWVLLLILLLLLLQVLLVMGLERVFVLFVQGGSLGL